jgi:hypothetical protein
LAACKRQFCCNLLRRTLPVRLKKALAAVSA